MAEQVGEQVCGLGMGKGGWELDGQVIVIEKTGVQVRRSQATRAAMMDVC